MLYESLSCFFANKIFGPFPKAIVFSTEKIRFGSKFGSYKQLLLPHFENSEIENIFILSGAQSELTIKNFIQNSRINIFILPIFELEEQEEDFSNDDSLDINFKFTIYSNSILEINVFNKVNSKTNLEFIIFSNSITDTNFSISNRRNLNLEINDYSAISNRKYALWLNNNSSTTIKDNLFKYDSSVLELTSFIQDNSKLNVVLNNDNSKKEYCVQQFCKSFMLDNSRNYINIMPNLSLGSDQSFGVHENWIGTFQKNLLFHLQLQGLDTYQAKKLIIISFVGETSSNFFDGCIQ